MSRRRSHSAYLVKPAVPVKEGDTTTPPPDGVDAVVTFTVDVASSRVRPPSVNHTLNTNSYDRPGNRLYGATYTCSTRDDIDDADSTLDARFVPFTLLAASSLMPNTDQADDNDDDSGSSAA